MTVGHYRRPSALKFLLLFLKQNLSLLFSLSYVVNMGSFKNKIKLSLKYIFLDIITNTTSIHCSFLKLFVKLLIVKHFTTHKCNSK